MLRENRLVRGLTQQELSLKTGIPVRRISYYERGLRLACLEDLRKMATVLGLEVKAAAEVPPKVEANLESWRQVALMCEEYGLAELPESFRQQVPCTPLQGLAWSQLVEQGARLGAASPTLLGLEGYRLVDEAHRGLGNQPLPCLSWNGGECRFVLWPQLRLRTPGRCYRLDALVLAAGWRSSRWAAFQLDGQQNDWDSRWRENLRLPVLPIEPVFVYRLVFGRRIQALLQPVPKLGLIDWDGVAGESLPGPLTPGRDVKSGRR